MIFQICLIFFWSSSIFLIPTSYFTSQLSLNNQSFPTSAKPILVRLLEKKLFLSFHPSFLLPLRLQAWEDLLKCTKVHGWMWKAVLLFVVMALLIPNTRNVSLTYCFSGSYPSVRIQGLCFGHWEPSRSLPQA